MYLSEAHKSFPRIQIKENMVGLIVGFTVYPNACTPKLAATLGTEFSCSSHLPTYIEMTANGGQVKSSSFVLPS